MSKKVTMSVARPSRAPQPEVASKDAVPSAAELATEQLTALATPPHVPERTVLPRPRGGTARLDQGIKRIVVDVAPSVHRQVKMKSIDYPGGIKEYILRLLEADGLNLRDQPDFVPRPK